MVNPAHASTRLHGRLTSGAITADARDVNVTLPPPTAAPAPVHATGPAECELLAVEQDRTALADLLHDGAVQALVSARWAIDSGDLGLAREAVQAALVELRHTVWHLRPRGPDLSGALEQLAARPGLGRPLVLAVDRGAVTTPAAAAAAYRLVQHLVTPPGPPLTVTLTERPDGVVLDLADTPVPAEPWPARLAALGGILSTSASDLRLTLPHAPLPTKAAP